MTRFQAAYISPQELAELVSRMLVAGHRQGYRAPSGRAQGAQPGRTVVSGWTVYADSDRLPETVPVKRLGDGVRQRLKHAVRSEGA
jgi:hypothetical protein